MPNHIVMSGGYIAKQRSGGALIVEPEFSIDTLFGDDELKIAEQASDQTVTAMVAGLEGSSYAFALHDSTGGEEDGSIAESVGFVGVGVTSISATFSAAELAQLTSTTSSVTLRVGAELARRTFNVESIPSPFPPQVSSSYTVESYPATISMNWQQRTGDTIKVEVIEPGQAAGVELAVNYQTTLNRFSFNVSAGVFDETKVYDLVVTVTGFDGQSFNYRVSLDFNIPVATPTNARITSHVDGQTLTDSTQTFVMDYGTDMPMPVGVWIKGFTDLNDQDGSKFYSDPTNYPTTDTVVTGVPVDGSDVYFEITPLPDNGSGGIDWGTLVPVIWTFPTTASPIISNTVNGKTIADPYQVAVDAKGQTVDSWIVRSGRTLGSSEFGQYPFAAGTLTQSISGHSDEDPIFITLYGVVGATETLHDSVQVRHAGTFTEHGRHENIGTLTPSSHFTEMFDGSNFELFGKSHRTYENIHIKVPDTQAMRDKFITHYNGGWRLDGCNHITIRNAIIDFPDTWHAYNRSRKIIYGGITSWKSHNTIIENVMCQNAHTSFRIDTGESLHLNNWISRNPFRHHIQANKIDQSGSHRISVGKGLGYITPEMITVIGTCDGMNFAGCKQGTVWANVDKVLMLGGGGPVGSGFLNEGPDNGRDRVGKIHFKDIGCIRNFNKAFSQGGGNGCFYENIWGAQENFITPSGDAWKRMGNIAAYEWDFRDVRADGRVANGKDLDFGKGQYRGCKTHWVRDGKVQGFDEVIISDSDTEVRKWKYGTPTGNEPDFGDTNQFDSDHDLNPLASGLPASQKGQKNWITPCVTEREIFERALRDLVDIPVFDTAFAGGTQFYDDIMGT